MEAADERPAPVPRAVEVSAPARLSFTLINLDGKSLRRNGIASIAVEEPSMTAQVRLAGGTASVTGTQEETAGELQAAVHKLRRLWDGPAATVTVTQPLPQHSGFGSKTTTLLGVGYAYAKLCGRQPDLRELSATLGRGRTSGASTNLARHGGFLVDCGHRNPPDFAADPHRYLLPSHFAQPVDPPTPLVKLPFPDWPILILAVEGRHIGGAEELAWFRGFTPIPPEESWRTAHLVFMGLAPAVAEQDYDAFCATVNELTFLSRFKHGQIALQGQPVLGVLEAGRAERAIDAIAMSSHGPACFAFTRDTDAARRWADGLRTAGVVKDFWFTRVRNHGLRATFLS
jgi:beta-ribofuranosylaminobenzene 5'-phosphate synthase